MKTIFEAINKTWWDIPEWLKKIIFTSVLLMALIALAKICDVKSAIIFGLFFLWFNALCFIVGYVDENIDLYSFVDYLPQALVVLTIFIATYFGYFLIMVAAFIIYKLSGILFENGLFGV